MGLFAPLKAQRSLWSCKILCELTARSIAANLAMILKKPSIFS